MGMSGGNEVAEAIDLAVVEAKPPTGGVRPAKRVCAHTVLLCAVETGGVSRIYTALYGKTYSYLYFSTV